MNHRHATSIIAMTAALSASAAMADVTAADVWSNQQAFYEAMGVSLGGLLTNGALVAPELNVILPQGIATMQVTTDASVSMIENSDGTVTISYPSPMSITVAGGAPGEGSFTLDFTMTHDSYDITASGQPGDITYVSSGQNLRFEPSNLQLDGTPEIGMTMSGFLSLDSWIGTSQVTEGKLITYTANSETGLSVAEFSFAVDDIVSNTSQTTLPLTSAVALSLPVGGSDPMNLSAALRDGLSVMVESTGEGSSSESSVTMGGRPMNNQSTTTGPQTAMIRVDETGAVVSAEASDFDITMNEPEIFPGDLEFGIDAITAAYDIPLNASEDPQDFRIATSLTGLTLADTIWNLFDPAAMLPRDPADISYDVTGIGTNGTDLLDIMGLMQLSGPPAIEVDEVTIENLRISAVGAEVTAAGAMTFDWTDFQTIPGIARPEGTVTVNINGANGLMDTLAAMGLIPEEELMMPRMMMGMFSTPVGDDMLQTVLEVNSEGHVLANGQRLQ